MKVAENFVMGRIAEGVSQGVGITLALSLALAVHSLIKRVILREQYECVEAFEEAPAAPEEEVVFMKGPIGFHSVHGDGQ